MTLQCTSHTSLPRSTFSPGNFEIGNFSKKGKTSCWGLFLPDLFTGPKYSRSICIKYHQADYFVVRKMFRECRVINKPPRLGGKARALREMIELSLINCNCGTPCHSVSFALLIWPSFSPQYSLSFSETLSVSLYLPLSRAEILLTTWHQGPENGWS